MREAAACRTLSRLPGRVTRLHSLDVITAVTVHGPVHWSWARFTSTQSLYNAESVPRFYSCSGRGASDPSVLVLSLEPSLLMAMLQVFADFLHLANSFALVGN